ncbi:carbohydrate-binding module family 20 protein, partial [Hypoxylon sp. CI-4A]
TTTNTNTASKIALTFNQAVATKYGETIKLVGSISELGSWNVNSAPALSASKYTAANPLWTTTLSLASGRTFEYKFVKVAADGSVTWESDPNRSYTVPDSCSLTEGAVTVAGTWR